MEKEFLVIVMKNLLLIGDSIRMGYDKTIKKALENKVNVIFPDENCRFAAYVFRNFYEWFGNVNGSDIDVIHWNVGLWDILRLFGDDPETPIDIYEYYIDRICLRMKKLCPNAKIIFANCTSVVSEKAHPDFMRRNDDVIRYNKVAEKIVKKHGFEINDLYTFSLTFPDEARSDAFHFYTDIGTNAITNKVLECVLPALGIEEKIEYFGGHIPNE